MGGIHAYNKGVPRRPLHPNAVVQLVERGELVLPTKEELSDRSKGDLLSKGVAILQTIWFVVQCLARLADHLPLTNLEVMTLAYTVMTVAMYIAWWDKPLDVSCAVRVPEKKVEAGYISARLSDTIMNYVVGQQDESANLDYSRRVPTFWAGEPDADDIFNADIIALLVAMVFGAVHCIAWFYAFPSHAELMMWRISAIAIVAILGGILMGLLATKVGRWGLNNAGISVVIGFCLVGAPAYIVARSILLVLSFTSLNVIPPTVYHMVQWTDLIPHI